MPRVYLPEFHRTYPVIPWQEGEKFYPLLALSEADLSRYIYVYAEQVYIVPEGFQPLGVAAIPPAKDTPDWPEREGLFLDILKISFQNPFSQPILISSFYFQNH